MSSPSADDFRALARSSPWRWTTLRFTARWTGTHPRPQVRAWLRRPADLRVESADGDLLRIVHEKHREVALLTSDGGRTVALPRAAAGTAGLVLRPDGLVERRPERWALDTDAPLYQDYFWVAMLDPLELADGVHGPSAATVPALEIDPVQEVDHAGRPAWEAVVRTTPGYEPRCSCCALLRSREVDEQGAADGGVNTVLDAYPDAYGVRLDVGTGVCVLTRAIGGVPMAVTGHEVGIEAVDEPMDDALFRQ